MRKVCDWRAKYAVPERSGNYWFRRERSEAALLPTTTSELSDFEARIRRDERLTVLSLMSTPAKFVAFARDVIRNGGSSRVAYFATWLLPLRLLDIEENADIAGWPSTDEWRGVLGPDAQTDALDQEFEELDFAARQADEAEKETTNVQVETTQRGRRRRC